MATVQPLNGIRYNLDSVKSIEAVATPPYDVISDEKKLDYAKQHPNNVIRLILPVDVPDSSDFYAHSSQLFKEWQESQILQRDEACAFYVMRESFETANGRATRIGVFGRLGIEPEGSTSVIPHERTHDKYVTDRLKLLEASSANYSPVFLSYKDESMTIEKITEGLQPDQALLDYQDASGVSRTLWAITDVTAIDSIRSMFSDKSMIIADGHHRYRTAQKYLEANPSATSCLAYMANTEQSGFVIRPIHRILNFENVPETFQFDLLLETLRSVEVALTEVGRPPTSLQGFSVGPTEIGIVEPSSGSFVTADFKKTEYGSRVATEFLDSFIIEKLFKLTADDLSQRRALSYFHDNEGYMKALSPSGKKLLCVMPALTFDQILATCQSGQVLPQKSTFFYPKVPTGLVINPLN